MDDLTQFETADGQVELSWGFHPYNDRPSTKYGGGIGCSIRVEEPYRESYGHSASLGPADARKMAAVLLAYADAEEANDHALEERA